MKDFLERTTSIVNLMDGLILEKRNLKIWLINFRITLLNKEIGLCVFILSTLLVKVKCMFHQVETLCMIILAVQLL